MHSLPPASTRTPVLLELDAGVHWWCSCGQSAHQPLCDGSHKGTGMAPTRFTLTERRKVWLCNCKHTRNRPYCDGSHLSPPEPPAAAS